jgi:hypothetical protein
MPHWFWRWLADQLYPYLADRWHAEERERRRKGRQLMSLLAHRREEKP